jgi:phosphinothricin acetyltransferase
MSWSIGPAAVSEFLDVAALDRIAWPVIPDTFIPDGEHIWRVWAEYATLLVARLAPEDPAEAVNAIAPSNKTADGEAVAVVSHQIVGALVMFPTRQGESFLHKIMVHPGHRGSGIGTALMRHALEESACTVLLTVDPANTAAVRLYENFGFRVRARVDGYYRPHEDRLVMEVRPSILIPPGATPAPAALPSPRGGS